MKQDTVLTKLSDFKEKHNNKQKYIHKPDSSTDCKIEMSNVVTRTATFVTEFEKLDENPLPCDSLSHSRERVKKVQTEQTLPIALSIYCYQQERKENNKKSPVSSQPGNLRIITISFFIREHCLIPKYRHRCQNLHTCGTEVHMLAGIRHPHSPKDQKIRYQELISHLQCNPYFTLDFT